MAEVTLTLANYDEIMASELPVLVDFWATWCGPCSMMAPVVAEIAEEYAGRLIVAKVDVDDQPALAEKNNIISIPTLKLFREGQVTASAIGFMPKEDLLEKLGL